jgi:hypothetical protein
MTTSQIALPKHQVVDDVRRVDGIPGVFRRGGKYLYLLTARSYHVLADGTVVDGLQLVRTDPRNPTRIEAAGQVFEGYEQGHELGVRWLGPSPLAP